MLDLLVKYAHDKALVAEPGFAPKTVKWAILFDASGHFIGTSELGDTSKKKNQGQEFARCPDLSQPELKALKGVGSHFLVASADVVALYLPDNLDAEKIAVLHGKHDYFVGLIAQAASVMPELADVAATLCNSDSLAAIQESLRANKAKPTDKITLMIGAAFPVNSSAWHDWWRQFRKSLRSRESSASDEPAIQMICFATGDAVLPASTHPKIVGLADVGGIGMGSPLIGYDKNAFESYFLKQSANGAVSEEGASAYRATLNHLLDKHSQRLAGAKVAHWFSNAVLPEEDPFSWIDEPEEKQGMSAQDRAKQLLRAISTGERADLAGNHFYALTLSGSGGRVMVRDWMEGQFEDLADSVAAWFSDLAVVNYSGTGLAKEPGIERVITCLLPPRLPSQQYDAWIKPVGAARTQLWKAALQKETTIPYSVLARVVLENRVFVQTGKLEEALRNNRDIGLIVSLLHTRMGLIKAYHSRKGGNSTMTPYLNEDHTDPAYHCGRLMAVLADVQREALGDVGAGVIQRFYAAASATPALILGRLDRTSKFHLSQISRRSPGLAHWYETKLASIWCHINDRLPKTLSLEEQSTFALGYYHQLAADNEKKA